MEFKIESINQFFQYRAPNVKIAMISVHYRTDKGFSGVVDMEQTGATKETIAEAVRKDAAAVSSLIGQSFK